jgi:hypothetical protein
MPLRMLTCMPIPFPSRRQQCCACGKLQRGTNGEARLQLGRRLLLLQQLGGEACVLYGLQQFADGHLRAVEHHLCVGQDRGSVEAWRP